MRVAINGFGRIGRSILRALTTTRSGAGIEVALINRAAPSWTPPPPAPVGKEIGALVGAVVVLAVVGYIHGLIGPWPFGG